MSVRVGVQTLNLAHHGPLRADIQEPTIIIGRYKVALRGCDLLETTYLKSRGCRKLKMENKVTERQKKTSFVLVCKLTLV